MTNPNSMQFSHPKQSGTNLSDFTTVSTPAAGRVSANGTPRVPKITRRLLGTKRTTQYVPIIGNPTRRCQTGETMDVPSFQPGNSAQKTNFASRKALVKVRLGISILPNKPQIQFRPPRRSVLRPVKRSDLTPESMTKLSLDELVDISGIAPGNDVMISNTTQVKTFQPSLGRVNTNTTSQSGTKKTGETDSTKSFQVPNEDETRRNKKSETKRNDDLQVKATGIPKTDSCRSKGLAVPCKITPNGAKTINNVSDGEVETEATDRAQKKKGAVVSSNHLRFPPRLPPIRLQGGNSSSIRDQNTKGEQSSAAALTSISKKAQKQKLEWDGAQAVNKRFISEQDGGKQSEVYTRTPDEKNITNKQGIFSYNNNGNTCPNGEKGKVYECRQEHYSLDESPPSDQDPGASLPQLSPDQLDDMLDMMINMTTEERPTSQPPDPNLNLKHGDKQGSPVERSKLPGFNLTNANVDFFNHTSPGIKHLPQPPTGFTPTTDMNPVYESPVQLANASSFSSNATPVFPHLMVRPIVPPPPGFQPMEIPLEVLENVTSETRTKSSAYLANERGVARGTDDEELHKLGQPHSTSKEWDVDDWCYVVQWPNGWRATNRDASYLSADVREQLHIDLGQLEGVTPGQPKLVDQPSNSTRTDHTGASQRVPHEEDPKNNGNNNHKQIMSNGAKGKTNTVGEFSIAPPSPKPHSEETIGSSSITNRQEQSTILTSSDHMTNLHRVSSGYAASDVMISSDSNWSQSTVDWKVDIEELLLLLSGPSDDIWTSEFQSVHTNFPSTEQATLCGVDSNTSAKHSRDVEFLIDMLTEVEEDSLEKSLSEGKWTDQEMDSLWRRDFTRNQNLHPTKNYCQARSFLREGKAGHGHGVRGFSENSDLHGQEEYDAKQDLGHGNSAVIKSVHVHHEENKSSRKKVGRIMQKMRNHSLASESYSSTDRLKKSKELSESSTGLQLPLDDRTKTDSDNLQVRVSSEASIPPDLTESHASAKTHKPSSGTPNQTTKELQFRTSVDSSDVYTHPRDRPTCDPRQQKGSVEQQCVEDTLQNTHTNGDVTEGVDSTEEDNLYPLLDCETEQYPPPMNWQSAPKLADVKKDKIYTQDSGSDEKCPTTIQYKEDVLNNNAKEHPASATCSPKMTHEDSIFANGKNAQKQRRHSKAYDQPLAEVERGSSSTLHGEDSLQQKVELVTTSSSSESCYVINGSQTLSIEEWMRINDEQLDHAIRMERISGGRPAKQVAPSTNTYQRILRWLKESDFSLIPRKKRAKQSRQH